LPAKMQVTNGQGNRHIDEENRASGLLLTDTP